MKKEVKLGLIQMSCTSDIPSNTDKAIKMIKKAAEKGAQIICTQELFKSQYFCQIEDKENYKLAESIEAESDTIKTFSTLATNLKVVLIISLFEKRAKGLYHNTAVVLDADGTYLGKYRKMHIPDDPYYYEKYYFTPGDIGFRSFKTKYAEIGVLICWDQWYPEAARLTAMRGAEIIFIPTTIGFGTSEEDSGYDEAWQTVQRGHAVANACFLAAVNRVGFEASPVDESGINFWGKSFVTDPYGRILKQASSAEEEIVICPIDLGFIDEVRDYYSYPFRDRRVDSYWGLTELFID